MNQPQRQVSQSQQPAPKYNGRGEIMGLNKHGFPCVFFKDRKADFFPYALGLVREAGDLLKAKFGIDLMPMYGTLLGIVRDGELIPHDDDFDMCYVSRQTTDHGICQEALDIMECLREAGYKVNKAAFGFFQVYVKDIYFDIFVGWVRDDQFRLYWGVPDGLPILEIEPLEPIDMYGVSFPAPRNRELILSTIYGSGWRSPDPSFTYTSQVVYHPNFSFLTKGWPKQTGTAYWNSTYAKAAIPEFPSQFAVFVAPELEKGARILDVGCGNGRDSMFFARLGHDVLGVDASQTAIQKATQLAQTQGLPAAFATVDLYLPKSFGPFVQANENSFDEIYARFFLHAIDPSGEMAFWRVVEQVLKPGGRLFIEARTINDPLHKQGLQVSSNESITDHYRRFIDPEALSAAAAKEKLMVEYLTVGKSMAKFRNDDPEVVRAVLKKPGARTLALAAPPAAAA
jgi:SAM-dependent methyltransferase